MIRCAVAGVVDENSAALFHLVVQPSFKVFVQIALQRFFIGQQDDILFRITHDLGQIGIDQFGIAYGKIRPGKFLAIFFNADDDRIIILVCFCHYGRQFVDIGSDRRLFLGGR